MRKTLALLLTLCLLLASTPVLAEEDASGTWYLVMLGMTAGTFELNADGTCAVDVSSDDGEQSLEGAWTQEEGNVSMTINDETLSLVYDGANLLFNAEDLAALGLDQSDIAGAGADLSVLSSLIQISREPGKITTAEFSAYQENGTLPEGKTEEDMAAIQEEMMSAFMALLDTAVGTFEEEEPGPELTVVEENFYVREGYWSQEGYYLAKVQNDNDVAVFLSNGSMVLKDAQDNEIGQAEYLGNTGSCYLEPGEATFISMYADINEGDVVESYAVNLSTSLQSYQSPDTSLDVSAAELRVKEEEYGTYYYTAATITNPTEESLANISAVLAVRASDGKLIDLSTSGLYQNELAAGSTITLVDVLDSRTAEYCANNGITPEQVEALAWIPVE